MNCKECEKLILNFISDSLSFKKLTSFLKHVENCVDCKEELAIQILIQEGMQRLEEGSAFDLQEAITKRMLAAKKRIKIHMILKNVRIILELCALLAVGVLILFFIL